MKDHKHGLTSDEGDELLNLLCSCVWAPPVSVPMENKQKLISISETVQTWLNNYWFCISKVIIHMHIQYTMHTHTHAHTHTIHIPKIHIIVTCLGQ